MQSKKLPPIHPGKILMEEFLAPMGISQYRLAKDISVSPRRINEIVHEKRSITADTALRLGRFFGMSPQFWLNLQNPYDLETTEDLIGKRLNNEVNALQRGDSGCTILHLTSIVPPDLEMCPDGEHQASCFL